MIFIKIKFFDPYRQIFIGPHSYFGYLLEELVPLIFAFKHVQQQ